MQNEKITIETHLDETGKMKVNVLTDGMKMADVLLALDKSHGAVMEVFEIACKAENVTSHYQRKALLQKSIFYNAKNM
jgi:hypothetical protein